MKHRDFATLNLSILIQTIIRAICAISLIRDSFYKHIAPLGLKAGLPIFSALSVSSAESVFICDSDNNMEELNDLEQPTHGPAMTTGL